MQARCIDLFYGNNACYMNVADVLTALSDDYTDTEREGLRELLRSVLTGEDSVLRMN